MRTHRSLALAWIILGVCLSTPMTASYAQYQEARTSVLAPASILPRSHAAPKVLLIISDEDIAKLFAVTLKQEGYQVTIVHSEVEGLNQARENQYDLVLCYWKIQDSDAIPMYTPGWKIAQEIKIHRSDLPILMVFEDAQIQPKSLESADGYLMMPFNKTRILAKIEDTILKSARERKAWEPYAWVVKKNLAKRKAPKVLVIEKDEEVGRVMKRALGYAGYGVVLARDSQAWTDALATGKFDVLICEEDVFKKLGNLRQRSAHTPLVLTTSGPFVDIDDPQYDDAKAVLEKPFAVEDLQDIVDRLADHYALETMLVNQLRSSQIPEHRKSDVMLKIAGYRRMIAKANVQGFPPTLMDIYACAQKEGGTPERAVQAELSRMRQGGPILLLGDFQNCWQFAKALGDIDRSLVSKLFLLEDLIQGEVPEAFENAVDRASAPEYPLVRWKRFPMALRRLDIDWQTDAEPTDGPWKDSVKKKINAQLDSKSTMVKPLVTQEKATEVGSYFYVFERDKKLVLYSLYLDSDYMHYGIGRKIIQKLRRDYPWAEGYRIDVYHPDPDAAEFWKKILAEGLVDRVGEKLLAQKMPLEDLATILSEEIQQVSSLDGPSKARLLAQVDRLAKAVAFADPQVRPPTCVDLEAFFQRDDRLTQEELQRQLPKLGQSGVILALGSFQKAWKFHAMLMRLDPKVADRVSAVVMDTDRLQDYIPAGFLSVATIPELGLPLVPLHLWDDMEAHVQLTAKQHPVSMQLGKPANEGRLILSAFLGNVPIGASDDALNAGKRIIQLGTFTLKSEYQGYDLGRLVLKRIKEDRRFAGKEVRVNAVVPGREASLLQALEDGSIDGGMGMRRNQFRDWLRAEIEKQRTTIIPEQMPPGVIVTMNETIRSAIAKARLARQAVHVKIDIKPFKRPVLPRPTGKIEQIFASLGNTSVMEKTDSTSRTSRLMVSGKVVSIEGLYLDPSYHGLGVGRRICQHVREKYPKEKGYWIAVPAVEDTLQAVGFWKQMLREGWVDHVNFPDPLPEALRDAPFEAAA